jgi:biotin carboxyl carrier protein
LILEISSADGAITVETTAAGGDRKIRLGDVEIICDWVRIFEGRYSLILDGSVFDLMVNLDADTCTVTSRAGTHSFRITDRRRPKVMQHAEEGPAGLLRMRAEMPGKIVRVLVREGESFAYDQGLLVLEAMKMQNEIRAPKSGTIKEVAVTGGITVNTGDFLLSIES